MKHCTCGIEQWQFFWDLQTREKDDAPVIFCEVCGDTFSINALLDTYAIAKKVIVAWGLSPKSAGVGLEATFYDEIDRLVSAVDRVPKEHE